jgi:hypothetical protein
MIRYIPIAIVSEQYKWMANFWAYCQKKAYGQNAIPNSLVAIVNQNTYNSNVYNSVDWELLGLPYYMSPPIWNYVNSKNDLCVVINVVSALKPLLKNFDDNDTLVLCDMDMVLLKPYNGVLPDNNTVICYDGYEDWHMLIANTEKQNYNKIVPYLKHQEQGYMNGGFVPIFIKAKLLKKIIDELIATAEEIVESNEESTWKWWSCMTALSIVCHNNKIKMVGQNNTYIPNFNHFNQNEHYFAHYSVDPIFNKRTFPNHDITKYPDNGFYNLVKEWIVN